MGDVRSRMRLSMPSATLYRCVKRVSIKMTSCCARLLMDCWFQLRNLICLKIDKFQKVRRVMREGAMVRVDRKM